MSKSKFSVKEFSLPSGITKEEEKVWNDWCEMRNREIIRETAIKGVHIKLAISFISKRKNINYDEAQSFFNEEVNLWVVELLKRKQIFRASHILQNIKLDPILEMIQVFIETEEKDLRNYIGDHLIKINKMPENLKLLWVLLQAIEDNSLILNIQEQCVQNISDLKKKDSKWKSEVGTKLLFSTLNFQLKPLLEKEIMWEFLLKNNIQSILALWINLTFSESQEIIDCDLGNITENEKNELEEIFKNHSIDKNMIDLLSDNRDAQISNETKNFVLNELSKYGIFSSKELDDAVSLIKRVVKFPGLTKLYTLLEKKNQTTHFLESLIKHCLKNNIYIPLNIVLNAVDVENFNFNYFNSSHLDLMISTKKMSTDFKSDELVIKNVFDYAITLSKNDLYSYFIENPLIFFALVLFYDIDLLIPIKENKSVFLKDIEISFDILRKVVKKLPILNKFIDELREESPSLTYYDLLKKHGKVDVNEVFNFQFSNEQYCTFDCPSRFIHEIYDKKADFFIYIRQQRPSIAAYTYSTSINTKINIEKVERFAIKNYDKPKLTATCVAFLKMINYDCNRLRNYLHIANLLDQGNEIKGTMLFSAKPEDVIKQIENINFIDDINSLIEYFHIFHLVELLKKYKILIQFAKYQNCKFPEELPTKLVENDLWLAFLIFIQYFNYPEDQVQQFCLKFNDPALKEHLLHGLSHDMMVEDSNSSILKERDSRSYFLSRIGVRKTLDANPQSVQGSICSASSIRSRRSVSSGNFDSSSSSSTISDVETELSQLGDNPELLQLLIKCHNSSDPPRMLLLACHHFKYPLLAILATCYEPDSVMVSWLTWLIVSSDLENKYCSAEEIIYSSESVLNLMVEVYLNQYFLTLLESFQIFIPENPLKLFLEVLGKFALKELDEGTIQEKMDEFNAKLKSIKSNPVIMNIDRDVSYVYNKNWIESVSLALLAVVLDNILLSSYEQIQVLELLIKCNANECLNIPLIYLENSLIMCQKIFEYDCKVRPTFLKILNQKNRKNYIQQYIDELISEKCYEVAFTIGRMEKINLDLIILQKWEYEFNEKHKEEDFWSNSLKEFSNVHQKPLVVEILEKCSEKVLKENEKYDILKIAFEWAELHKLENKYLIEKKLWISFVKLKNYDLEFPHYFGSESFSYSYVKNNLKVEYLSEEELEGVTEADKGFLNTVIDSLLNNNKFTQAVRISNMFRYHHEDLTIIIFCQSLAEGLIVPSELNVDQKFMISKAIHSRNINKKKKRPYVSMQLSNIRTGWFNSRLAIKSKDLDGVCNDTLKILEVLSERVENGYEMAQKVFLTYRISINLNKKYQQVLECTEPVNMLQISLQQDCSNKLQIIQDFITVWKWSKEMVVDFVSKEVVSAIETFTKAKIEGIVLWDLDLDRDFSLILQFFPENTSSSLGTKLFYHADYLFESQNLEDFEFRISELQMIIEILIRAHDCFTVDCNMEGICLILKKCKTIISMLVEIKSWKLIVRLLTGVGRYTEMSYVFQILKENDHFEFLLRKGNRKDNSLKTALLNYLKKFCPENKDLYRMVALHFTLYSEIAQLWEEEAQGLIKNLISISKLEMQNNGLNPEEEMFVLFTNDEGTKLSLNKAMQNYVHASEYHLQAEKLMKALNSARQAELIALQLSLFRGIPINSSCRCLLNLNNSQISSLIILHLRFPQSIILAEAYKYQPDWASALYEQFVLQNQVDYFDSFLNSFPITDTLVNDVSRKYMSSTSISSTATKNMKEILKNLDSVYTRYRIASELGFADIVEDLLEGNRLAYLRDTVWKKGYKG